MLLNDTDSRQLRRFRSICDFNDKNAAVYDGYEPYKQEAQKTKANLAQFIGYIPKKDFDAAMAATDTKQDLREDLEEKLYNITSQSLAYAYTVKNNELITLFSPSESAIAKMKDGELSPFATKVVDAVTPLIGDKVFQTYLITDKDTAALLAASKDYDGYLSKPGLLSSQASIASKNIKAVITLLVANQKQLKLLVVKFRKTNPDFVKGLKDAAKLDSLGVRHYGVEGIVSLTKGGTPVANAVLTNKKNKVIGTTDEKGAFKVKLGRGKRTIIATDPATGKTVNVELFIKKAGYLPLSINLEGGV